MEIKKEVIVSLTPKEVENIIKEHLKRESINIDSVHFRIGSHNVEGDWSSSLAPDYTLDEIICKGQDI